jgi:glycine dehydrogenase subunit 2
MGFDVVHLNLHKTFSTPHGGGGPGAGPVGVSERLLPYLPTPVVVRDPGDGTFRLDCDRPLSIGPVRSFYGNFGVLVRAYAYILRNGEEGLAEVSAAACANAAYLRERLRPVYAVAYEAPSMHEFVLTGTPQKDLGCSTLDIAKRLVDYGFHPPTVYFPLVVKEALMVEPTETETRETLDAFADAMLRIAEEVRTQPELLRDAPHATPVSRLDELRAARVPVLRWKPGPV